MTIWPGEFWVADIPYTDQSETKKRPVLVLWLDGADVVAAVVISSRRRTQTDVELKEWRRWSARCFDCKTFAVGLPRGIAAAAPARCDFDYGRKSRQVYLGAIR